MKKILLVFFLYSSISFSYSQSFNITGGVQDTLGTPLVAATVLLLDTDSTMVEFSETGLDGTFKFGKIQKGDYLVKVTYIGYFSITIPVQLENKSIDLGTLKMKEIATELMEVVIKAAKAPLYIKGDTVEYDASQFIVPEGSVLQDLLRRLPGLEQDKDGNIKSDGKDVTKLTVEGKTFFGDDPSMAIKNLPAESVQRVQVFDRKSEQAKITNDKSPSDEKEMNITLKEEFKKFGFGKASLGVGNVERKEGKFNYNRFNPKHQFSVVGIGNNTGRNGLSWDDYQDFMGSQSFNFSGDYTYGFGSGGGYRSYNFSSGGSTGLDTKVENLFFSGSNGGFPKNVSGGVNYNYDIEKTKLSARYFLASKGNLRNTLSESTSFLPLFTSQRNSSARNEVNTNLHRLEFALDHELDSLTSIKFKANYSNLSDSNLNSTQQTSIRDNTILTNDSQYDNKGKKSGNLLQLSALINKTISKKAGVLSANAIYTKTNLLDNINTESIVNFYENNSIDSITNINQDYLDNASNNKWEINAMYNNSLSKRFSVTLFENYNSSIQNGDINVNDIANGGETLNTSLSRLYDTNIKFNRSGGSIVYAMKAFSASVGTGYQNSNLGGDFKGKSNPNLNGKVDEQYTSWIHYANIWYQMDRNSNFSLNASTGIAVPEIEDLLPIVNNRNPLYIKTGNPNLQPATNSSYSMNLWASRPASGLRINFNTRMELSDNVVVVAQEVNENLVTYATPMNYKNGKQYSGYFGLSFPIKKNKIKSSLNIQASNNQNFTLINNIENKENTTNWRPRLTLDITPNDNMGIYLAGNFSNQKTNYSINTGQNQTTVRTNYSAEFNTKLLKGLFLVAKYDHQIISNERYGQSVNIPIINASIYKQFLNKNRGELRFSIYDALNKNRGYNVSSGINGITKSDTQNLARYFMLSFTYNLRGMKSNNERNNFN